MPIVPYQRITSSGPVITSFSGDAAVDAILCGGGGVPAVPVLNSSPDWPRITLFENDNNAAFSKTNPSVIWSKPVADSGERAGFAAQSNTFGLKASAAGANFVIALAVFADNAVSAKIQAFNTLGVTVPESPPLFLIGSLDVDLEDVDIHNPNRPEDSFGWQKIRYYTIPVSTGPIDGAGMNLKFVLSFEVLNYLSSSPHNPGGLAFIADIYGDVPVLPPIVMPRAPRI